MFVVNWTVPTWANCKGTLQLPKLLGRKPPIRSPGTAILCQVTSVGMENESWDTIHQEFLRATSPLSKCLHLVALSTPVPKFSGWALLCHGRKGDCIHYSVCPRPCKCTDSGFWSMSSLCKQLLDPDRRAATCVS